MVRQAPLPIRRAAGQAVDSGVAKTSAFAVLARSRSHYGRITREADIVETRSTFFNRKSGNKFGNPEQASNRFRP
jgi:hypothetical protein